MTDGTAAERGAVEGGVVAAGTRIEVVAEVGWDMTGEGAELVGAVVTEVIGVSVVGNSTMVDVVAAGTSEVVVVDMTAEAAMRTGAVTTARTDGAVEAVARLRAGVAVAAERGTGGDNSTMK